MVMQKISLEENQSENLVQQNIEHLKQIFPEVFSEGKVNFETLRQLLGDQQVLDEGEEKYGLNWHGKKKARQSALTPSLGTLLPCPEESVDWDKTQNLFIEGDNLEVLKLLQKSYTNKVKLIYIDPPYNTGKEFIYPDNFQENLQTYLEYTGQLGEEGEKLFSQSESQGRKHTAWLNMMLPRLLLARELLTRDGAIFISIDDNELHNLRALCDEIFGSENFVATIIWHKKYAASNDAKGIPSMHDYILVYQKSESFDRNLLPRTEKQDSLYKYDSNDGKGRWRPDNLTVKTVSESYLYPIINPNTGVEYLPTKGRCWLTNSIKMQEWISEGRVFFGQKGDGAPQLKRYLSEVQNGIVPTTYWSYEDVGHTDSSRKELKQLFENSAPFDNPKPTALMKQIFNIVLNKSDIILDFFAGSGTTGHAVYDFNLENETNHRFILVQLPEDCDQKSEAYKAGFKKISDITVSRLKLALNQHHSAESDLGFKVFKLAQSNIQPWNPDPTDLEATLLESENHLIEGRTEQDILYELLLKRGIDLATPIAERKAGEKTVYSIGYGATFACLDEHIQAGDIEFIAQLIIDWYQELAPGNKPHIFFRDSAFENDVVKTNIAAILQQNGLDHVRSL